MEYIRILLWRCTQTKEGEVGDNKKIVWIYANRVIGEDSNFLYSNYHVSNLLKGYGESNQKQGWQEEIF